MSRRALCLVGLGKEQRFLTRRYYSATTAESAGAAMLSAGAAVVSAGAAVVSAAWQHWPSEVQLLVLLLEQATSIAATAAIANRFFIIVYLINVVVVTPVKTPQSYSFRAMVGQQTSNFFVKKG